MSFRSLNNFLAQNSNGEPMASTQGSSIKSNNMTSLLDYDDQTEGFDENFEPPVTSIVECPICLLVLRNPYQTDCGHRFCYLCILKVIKEGRQKCPIDNEDLDESQINPDNFAKREILNLGVRCRHYTTDNCDWLGPLKELEDHLAVCGFQKVNCSNGCGISSRRSELAVHLAEQCEKRIEECLYCKIQVVVKNMEDHCSKCHKFPVLCPNGCSEVDMPREQLEDHLAYECALSVIKCPFEYLGCSFEGPRLEVNKHFAETQMMHSKQLVDKLEQLSGQVQSEIAPVKSLRNASTTELSRKVVELDKMVATIDSKAQEAGEKADQGLSITELYYTTLNSNITKVEQEVKAQSDRCESRAQILNELQAKIWSGNFIWKITNFETLFQQSVSGDVPAIHSAPFYSGIPGYKMCLRVNLFGVDSGASTHVSMFVHLMQGDFDSILPWPFPGKIVLTAVDQSENEPNHVTETLVSRPGLQAFLRPKAPRNHKGYGYVEMIAHTVLRTRQYVKNNSMIVHVAVSAEQ